jgi:hypothetical protein
MVPMFWVDFLILLTLFIFFLVSMGLIWLMYVCDNETCKPFIFIDAPKGSREYALVLLESLFNEAFWCVPCVAGFFVALLVTFFVSTEGVLVKNFVLVFFMAFLIMYFLISFLSYHYINPITAYLVKYIEAEVPEDGPYYNTPEGNMGEDEIVGDREY